MKIIIYTFLAFCTLLFGSCSPAINLVDTSCPGYKSDSFERQHISENRIAIMPVLSGAGKEQFRRPMSLALYSELSNEFGDANVVPSNLVVTKLNDKGLSQQYTQAIQDYNTSGIIPQDLITNVCENLEVDYLLYTYLLADQESAYFSIDKNEAEIYVDELYVQTQIWSKDEGDVVWEGKGGVAVRRRVNEDLVIKSAKGLTSILGNVVNDGPCADPRDLIKSKEQRDFGCLTVMLFASGIMAILTLILSG